MSAVICSPCGARGFDSRDHLVDLRPVLFARRLQVIDLGRHLRFPRDSNQLVDRLEQPLPSLRMCEMYMPPYLPAASASAISSSVLA